VASLLKSGGVEVRGPEHLADRGVTLAVLDGPAAREEAERFLAAGAGRRVILFGDMSAPAGAVVLAEKAGPAAIREAVRSAIGRVPTEDFLHGQGSHQTAVCG
jgi:hypothetical protein